MHYIAIALSPIQSFRFCFLHFCIAVFAKRRIRLDPGNISQFILNTDLDGLLSEHCELLLQIVPQEKEVECAHTLLHNGIKMAHAACV